MFYKRILKYSPHRCLFFGKAFEAFQMSVSAYIYARVYAYALCTYNLRLCQETGRDAQKRT